MSRLMGDSVNITMIPPNVDLIATYVDGSEGVIPATLLEKLFPSSRYFRVTIDVMGNRPDAKVRDWETGDKGGDLEKWVVDHNNVDHDDKAVIYCNVSTIPEVRRLTGSQILDKDYFLWVATLDGMMYKAPGVIACQNRGAELNGRNYDSSVVFDDGFWKLPANVVTTQVPSVSKPDCRNLQRALRVTVDNMWGTGTDQAAAALIAAWSNSFPYGIAFVQYVVGTRKDGSWGPNSKRAMHLTTTSVQKALMAMGYNPGAIDGVWGPNTNEAYVSARSACHI